MKTRLLIYFCSIALAAAVFGQTPAPSSTSSASPSPSATTPMPAATPGIGGASSVSPAPTADDDIARLVKRKLGRHHHMGVTVNGKKDIDLGDLGDMDSGEAGGIAVAIIGVIFTTLFGAPVLIVAAVMFFSYLKSRSLHRTVRMMVEKGQPVPPELFATPGSPLKQRNDLRRGVVLSCIGIGLIIFLAGVNGGFGGGEWAVGVIPLMVGLGYLLVWKLEGAKKNGNNITLRDTPPVA